MWVRRGLELALWVIAVSACSSTPGQKMCPNQSNDIITFQSIQSGTIEALDGLRRIAMSDGWPIQGCTGYLFAVPDPDGALAPYSVESTGSAFPRVALTSQNGVAWALVPIAYPEGATYFFTAFDGRVVPDAYSRTITFDKGTEVSLVRPTAGAHFERWPQLGDASGAIKPREVKVWVPAETPTRVLYLHDGQDAFGPALDVPSLVSSSTLVVGIDSDPTMRLQEYQAAADFGVDGQPVGQRSIPYVDYVQNVVRPLIESRYGRAAKNAVVGCGAGASAALKQPVRFPDTWSLAAGVSGDYGVGHVRANNPTLYEQWVTLRTCPQGALYLGGGGSPPDGGCADLDGDAFFDDPPGASDSYCQTKQLEKTLRGLGCPSVTVEQLAGGERCGATYSTLLPHIISQLEAP